MKIIFIRPSLFNARSKDAMQPLVFAILAQLTPDDVKIEFYDERIEETPNELDCDLIAMTVETYTAARAYNLADHFRKQEIKIVMGGNHPTFLADEALEHADAVVVGDAEDVWPQLVADIRNNNLKEIYKSDKYPCLDELKFDRSIFRGKKYLPVLPLQYGRGCKYNCEFCSVNAFYGKTLRQRPILNVVRELEDLSKNYLFIVDDNILNDISKAKELFEALIPLNVRWACQVSIDIARNERLLRLMAISGCVVLIVGFESLDTRNLHMMKKGWNVNGSDYRDAIQKIRNNGIMLYGTFVFGYDYDTIDSFKICTDFAIENKFVLANFNPLTPMPGSALYDRLKKEKRLLYEKWWIDPSYRYGQAIFTPKGMTAEELTAGCYTARNVFNTFSSIGKRALDFQTNSRGLARFGLYLRSNLVSRKEIHSKQGKQLGI